MWELVGELHRHPAAERMPDDGHALDVEHRQQVAHPVGVARDRVVGARFVGLPVSQQIGGDHREPLSELGLHGIPGRGVVADAVDQQDRRPGAGDTERSFVPVDGAVFEAGVVTSRTGRRLLLRFRSVISPPLLSRPFGRLSRVVVVALLLRLLGQESLELGTKLVAARKVFVAC